MSDDNVISLPSPSNETRVTPTASERERHRVADVLVESSEQQPRPIGVTFKALGHLLRNCVEASQLTMVRDPLEGGNEQILAKFDVPHGITTSVKTTTRPLEALHYCLMGQSEIDLTMRALFDKLPMVQCFSLRPVHLFLTALLTFGATLHSITRDGDLVRVFTFSVNANRQMYEIVVTLRLVP